MSAQKHLDGKEIYTVIFNGAYVLDPLWKREDNQKGDPEGP